MPLVILKVHFRMKCESRAYYKAGGVQKIICPNNAIRRNGVKREMPQTDDFSSKLSSTSKKKEIKLIVKLQHANFKRINATLILYRGEPNM